MDIEAFKKDLSARMSSFITEEHARLGGDAAQRAATLGKFRTELKTTINRLVDERKILFSHDRELTNFMTELNQPIEELMNRYISG